MKANDLLSQVIISNICLLLGWERMVPDHQKKKAFSISRELKADTSLGAGVWKIFPE